MTRIVEHRSALPFGPAVEVHVRYDPEYEFPVHANVEVSEYGRLLEPTPFPEVLPVADAFLQALTYAERTGIACVWIDDPGGYFPPNKRPVRDVREPKWRFARSIAAWSSTPNMPANQDSVEKSPEPIEFEWEPIL